MDTSKEALQKVANKIRTFRRMQDLTQEWVANQLGISLSAYGEIERGATDPSLTRLLQISETLNFSLRDLFEGPGNVYINSQNHILSKNSNIASNTNSDPNKEKEIELYEKRVQDLEEQVRLLKELMEVYKQK